MKIGFITIATSDMAAAVGFYETVFDFSVLNRFSPGPDMEIAFMGDGHGHTIELIARGGVDPAGAANVSIGFEVSDMDSVKRHLEAHEVPIVTGPRIMPNGVQLMTAQGPDGVGLGFVSYGKSSEEQG